MKCKYYIPLLTGLIIIVISLLPYLAMAQGDPGGNPDAPIDGGLGLLLAAGVGYGIKKYRDGKKKNVAEEKEMK